MNSANRSRPPTAVLDRFAERRLIRTTPQAEIWKVALGGGAAGALKVYRGAIPHDELAGIAAMRLWAGRGGVTVLDCAPDMGWLLTEWLEGPAVIDLVREGRDDTATDMLARTARALHRRAVPVPGGTKPFAHWMRRLMALRFAPDCPADLRRGMETAQEIYRTAALPEKAMRLLHGDLHHGNVIVTADGPRALDAKGMAGPLAFELAGALRAPRGYNHILLDRVRLDHRLETWSAALECRRETLLRWGIVQCARTIAWRARGTLAGDDEAALLAFLIARWREPG